MMKANVPLSHLLAPPTFRFGPFVLDVTKRKLSKAEQPLRVTAKCFALLLALVTRPGRVVSKEDLIAAAWGQAEVSDASLSQHIFMLRKVLCDTNRDEYIVAAPGIGYRFLGNVRADGAASALKRSLADEYCANAKEFWERRNEAAVRSALALYQEALRHDPQSAPAFGGIAECYYILADYMFVHPKESLQHSQTAAKHALLIDLQCPEAYVAMAKTAVDLDWKWDSAMRSLERAREQDGGNHNALFLTAWYLILQRKFTEAEAYLARGLPPKHGNRLIQVCPGILELYAGSARDARKRLAVAVDKHPDLWLARMAFAQALFLCGERGEACNELDRVRHAEYDPLAKRQTDIRFMAAGYLVYCLVKTGFLDQAQQVQAELDTLAKQRYVPALTRSLGNIAHGRYEQAIACIEQSRQDRCCWYTQLHVEPFVDELRQMPGFQALLPGPAGPLQPSHPTRSA